MFAFARTWAVVAILPLLGTLGIVSGTRLYRCAGDQITRTECCCPADATSHEASDSVSAACCCEITRIHARVDTSEPARTAAAERPLLAVIAALPNATTDVRWIAVHSFRSLSIRPPPVPILLLKQSFLI